jgi:hypothetical protein
VAAAVVDPVAAAVAVADPVAAAEIAKIRVKQIDDSAANS